MEHLLLELENELKTKGFKSYRFLQEGYSREEINAIIAENKVAYPFPEEVYQLYQWHNGISCVYTQDSFGSRFFTCGLFYPLEVACELYNHYLTEGILSPNYFPLFGNGDTINCFIDLDKGSNTYGSINSYDYYLEHPMKMYPSLTALFSALNECYTTGAYFTTEDGSWEENQTSSAIQKKYGEGAEYWG